MQRDFEGWLASTLFPPGSRETWKFLAGDGGGSRATLLIWVIGILSSLVLGALGYFSSIGRGGLQLWLVGSQAFILFIACIVFLRIRGTAEGRERFPNAAKKVDRIRSSIFAAVLAWFFLYLSLTLAPTSSSAKEAWWQSLSFRGVHNVSTTLCCLVNTYCISQVYLILFPADHLSRKAGRRDEAAIFRSTFRFLFGAALVACAGGMFLGEYGVGFFQPESGIFNLSAHCEVYYPVVTGWLSALALGLLVTRFTSRLFDLKARVIILLIAYVAIQPQFSRLVFSEFHPRETTASAPEGGNHGQADEVEAATAKESATTQKDAASTDPPVNAEPLVPSEGSLAKDHPSQVEDAALRKVGDSDSPRGGDNRAPTAKEPSFKDFMLAKEKADEERETQAEAKRRALAGKHYSEAGEWLSFSVLAAAFFLKLFFLLLIGWGIRGDAFLFFLVNRKNTGPIVDLMKIRFDKALTTCCPGKGSASPPPP